MRSGVFMYCAADSSILDFYSQMLSLMMLSEIMDESITIYPNKKTVQNVSK